MLGKIYLFDTNINKIIKVYSDKDLYNDNNQNERIEIRDKFLEKYNDRFKLICGCNRNIELSIDSIGRVYHKSKSDLDKHDRFCKRHKHYDFNISKGWTDNNKEITAKLNFSIFPNKDMNKLENFKKSKDSINIEELSKHINIKASEKPVKDKFDILSRAYFISKNITIHGFKNKKLGDFYFDIKDFKKINQNTPKFVYMYLSDISEYNESHIKLKCEYAKDKYFHFLVSKDLFYKQYLSNKINKINSPIIISGFINKSINGLEFYHISLIKVNNDGIY